MVIHQKKKQNLTDKETKLSKVDTEFADKQGDRWTFVAVLPDTSFIHTVHSGKRTSEQAGIFLKKIKDKSDQVAPLFLSDAWFYEEVLYTTYCHYEPTPYKGRGRRPLPKRIVDKNLKYAQVYKQRDKKGKLIRITQRIIRGIESEILDIIRKNGRSKTINTSFVESRNGKYRKDDARLNRKTMCHSKKAKYHDAHINLLTALFNYCRDNKALRELINPTAGLFETKYAKKSPAMAEGLIDKILTIKELFFWRVPKPSIH